MEIIFFSFSLFFPAFLWFPSCSLYEDIFFYCFLQILCNACLCVGLNAEMISMCGLLGTCITILTWTFIFSRFLWLIKHLSDAFYSNDFDFMDGNWGKLRAICVEYIQVIFESMNLNDYFYIMSYNVLNCFICCRFDKGYWI